MQSPESHRGHDQDNQLISHLAKTLGLSECLAYLFAQAQRHGSKLELTVFASRMPDPCDFDKGSRFTPNAICDTIGSAKNISNIRVGKLRDHSATLGMWRRFGRLDELNPNERAALGLSRAI
jgi:hypothetical protein